MIAIIKGDIIASRKLDDQNLWMVPLKKLLSSWGPTPETWEIVWGDFFQVEIECPEEAMWRAFQIKALIKSIATEPTGSRSSAIDVKMGIGLGEKTHEGARISESNGPAFVFAAEAFDNLRKDVNLYFKSPWIDFDEEINLYVQLLGAFTDAWTISSAELVAEVLRCAHQTQEELGKKLQIKQNSVSGRWNRAHTDELLAVEAMFRKKLILKQT